MTKEVPQLIKVELIMEPSISVANNITTTEVDVAMISVTKPCWMDPIIDFIVEDRVPDDENEANRIHRVAVQYWLSADRKLYGGLLGDRTFHACTPRK